MITGGCPWSFTIECFEATVGLESRGGLPRRPVPSVRALPCRRGGRAWRWRTLRTRTARAARRRGRFVQPAAGVRGTFGAQDHDLAAWAALQLRGLVRI